MVVRRFIDVTDRPHLLNLAGEQGQCDESVSWVEDKSEEVMIDLEG